ncbi:MAG: hypothetical protein WA184_17385 [Stellaceae bacterium]
MIAAHCDAHFVHLGLSPLEGERNVVMSAMSINAAPTATSGVLLYYR